MRDVYGDTTILFFRRIIDLAVISKFCQFFGRQNFSDGGGQSSFAVVDMSDGSDVAVRFVALEHLLLWHTRTKSIR